MSNTIHSNRGGRNNTIDFIKGICILFVIFTHYGWTDEQWHKLLFPYWIDMAVPIFMAISGFVYAKSFEKKNIQHLEEAYDYKELCCRITRFSIPFAIAMIVSLLAEIIIRKSSCKDILLGIIRGGFGPGSYYYPIMMQFIFIFPFIYFVIKSSKIKGLVICFVINLLYEFIQSVYFVNEDLYRLLVLRYIFIISWGCFVALNPEVKLKKWKLIGLSILGALFIYITTYTGYKPLFIVYWTRTSCVASLYIIIFVYIFLTSEIKLKNGIIELFGRASFNIFLVQMVYYCYLSGRIYLIVDNRFLRLLINFFVCLLGGIVFYYTENPVSRKIIEKIKK